MAEISPLIVTKQEAQQAAILIHWKDAKYAFYITEHEWYLRSSISLI